MRLPGSHVSAAAGGHQDYLVTAAEAAQIMGLSDRALEDLRRRGASPAFLLLGHGPSATVLYREAAVLDWRNRLHIPRISVPNTAAIRFGHDAIEHVHPTPNDVLGDVYLSAVEVCRKIGGVGKSTLYLWIKKGIFPPGTRVGPRRTAWSSKTVDQWLERQATDKSANS